MRFLGHTPVRNPYDGWWDCPCGVPLGRSRRAARELMAGHRHAMLLDALDPEATA